MTQHFIRKLARFEWLKRSYYRLYEPRVVCVVYGAIYTRPYSWQATTSSTYPAPSSMQSITSWLLWVRPIIHHHERGSENCHRRHRTLLAGKVRRHPRRQRAHELLTHQRLLTIFSGGSRILSLFTTTLAFVRVLLRFYWIFDRPHNPGHRRT